MRGSEFSELQAFLEVVKQGNFGRAAASLHVNRSTLSQTIRHLEERLGTRLLNRTTRSLALTDAGARLHARITPVVHELESAVADTGSHAAEVSGLLRVQVPRHVAESRIMPALGAFHLAYPDVKLELEIDDRNRDIVAAGFDIGIRLGEFLEKDMRAVRMGPPLKQIAFASKKYLAKHGRPTKPEELLEHACINWRMPSNGSLYAWEFQKRGKWFSVAVDGPMIVSDRRLMVAAALQHVGVGFWTDDRIAHHVKAGHLVPLLEPYCAQFPGFHAYYPKQRVTPPAVKAFVEFFRT